jgi:signal transduction histidine kinase
MPDRGRPADPVGQLVTATGRRLYLWTLALVALLVVGIGLATALAGLSALDADVDRALAVRVDAELGQLDGELPSPGEEPESDERPSGQSDTFVVDLDRAGRMVANPSRVALSGLPVAAAVAAARSVGRDLRTVELGGIPVRLLTVPIGGSGNPTGFVQAGLVLTLHDREEQSLALTFLLAALVGLAGAAFVTLLVTRRALVPIRRAVEGQLRFVADASHELRTPAAIIRATADVLQREGRVAPAGRPLLADIVAESERLATLVADLLTLATTGSGGLVLSREPVDVGDIAGSAARRAEALAAERGVRIEVAPPSGGAVVVHADRDRLDQLLLILLDNAVAHSPASSVVEIGVERAGSTVRLTVSDRGPGIAASDRERVFEPFARLDRSPHAGRGNAGLGLAIARRLALAQGGHIIAAERPGGGARFVVTLPVGRSEATRVA